MAESFEGTPIKSWGSFTPQATVPTIPSSTSVPTSDPISTLIAQMGAPVTEKEIQAATTPIAGTHAAQLPSSMTTPITPHQDAPLDYRPVVGAGNARARGIGNTVTAVMNGLGRVVTAEAQNKQNQIRDSATKVITSQQAIDEAQQQLDMAMQSGDTTTVAKMKDIIQQNTQARDAIFADPKMRKALVKGFNFNYVDPTQNKTTEHAAVQEAIKGAKTRQEKIAAIKALQAKQNTAAGAAAGAAYAKAQPQGLAPNTQAQMQVQMKMAAQKNMVDSIRALAPVWSAQTKAGADLTIADKKAQVALRVAAVNNASAIDKQLLVNKQHQIDNAAARSLALYKAHLDAWVKSIDTADPANIMKNFGTASSAYQTQISDIQKSRQALNLEVDKESAAHGSAAASRVIELRRQLQNLDAQQTSAQNSFYAAQQYAAKMTGLDINQFKVDVPVPQVGDGANASPATKSSTSADSADVDPRTGQPFNSDVPTADRILIRAHHALGEAGIGAARGLENINRETQRVKQFFGSGRPD